MRIRSSRLATGACAGLEDDLLLLHTHQFERIGSRSYARQSRGVWYFYIRTLQLSYPHVELRPFIIAPSPALPGLDRRTLHTPQRRNPKARTEAQNCDDGHLAWAMWPLESSWRVSYGSHRGMS